MKLFEMCDKQTQVKEEATGITAEQIRNAWMQEFPNSSVYVGKAFGGGATFKFRLAKDKSEVSSQIMENDPLNYSALLDEAGNWKEWSTYMHVAPAEGSYMAFDSVKFRKKSAKKVTLPQLQKRFKQVKEFVAQNADRLHQIKFDIGEKLGTGGIKEAYQRPIKTLQKELIVYPNATYDKGQAVRLPVGTEVDFAQGGDNWRQNVAKITANNKVWFAWNNDYLKAIMEPREVKEDGKNKMWNTLAGQNAYDVYVGHNFMDSGRYQLSARPFRILAASPEEAKQWVTDNLDTVENYFRNLKVMRGKRAVPAIRRSEHYRAKPTDVGYVKPSMLIKGKIFNQDGDQVPYDRDEQQIPEDASNDIKSKDPKVSQMLKKAKINYAGRADDDLSALVSMMSDEQDVQDHEIDDLDVHNGEQDTEIDQEEYTNDSQEAEIGDLQSRVAKLEQKKGVNEDAEEYGVYPTGGSIGSAGTKPYKTFDNKPDAQAYANRMRKQLTRGERGYYKMGYRVKPIKPNKAGVNEDAEEYGVYPTGGSIGSASPKPYKTFDNKPDAQAYARRMRKHLTKGEKSYYKMGYRVKPIKPNKAGVNEGESVHLNEGALQNVLNFLWDASGKVLDKMPVIGDKRAEQRVLDEYENFVATMDDATVNDWIDKLTSKLKSSHPASAKASTRRIEIIRKAINKVKTSKNSSDFRQNMRTLHRSLNDLNKFIERSNKGVSNRNRKAGSEVRDFEKSLNDESVNEAGIGKTIKKGAKWLKRGMQGWDSNYADPKDMERKHQEYDTDTLNNLSDFHYNMQNGKAPTHSPHGLQQQLIKRNLRKRGQRDFEKYMNEAEHSEAVNQVLLRLQSAGGKVYDKAHLQKGNETAMLAQNGHIRFAIFQDGTVKRAKKFIEFQRDGWEIEMNLDESGEYPSNKLSRAARKYIPGHGKRVAKDRADDYGYSAHLDANYAKYHGDEDVGAEGKRNRRAQERYNKIAGRPAVGEAVVPNDGDEEYPYWDDETGELFPAGKNSSVNFDNDVADDDDGYDIVDAFRSELNPGQKAQAQGMFGDIAAGGGDPVDHLMTQLDMDMEQIDALAVENGYHDANEWAESYAQTESIIRASRKLNKR